MMVAQLMRQAMFLIIKCMLSKLVWRHKTNNSESDLKVHYHKYDREYANSGY